jgi:hypothetical protein
MPLSLEERTLHIRNTPCIGKQYAKGGSRATRNALAVPTNAILRADRHLTEGYLWWPSGSGYRQQRYGPRHICFTANSDDLSES